MDGEIADINLAEQGETRIDWAARQMPVLARIKEKFARARPLDGLRVAACLHVTTETANLVRVIAAGGASVVLCASNPLSTQDDVAACLVARDGIPVFAIKGEDAGTYRAHLRKALASRPSLIMDDGADLITAAHTENLVTRESALGATEETTTGVTRLRAMERLGDLCLPVIAVNEAATKHLFDNRYGTGQSTIDGIIRATNMLLAGKTVVVCGYGWCGRGVAMRARGMGADVVVTEVDQIKALEAAMDGHRVMPMAEAAKVGDVFVTATGNIGVVRAEHLRLMKDGTVLANTGHFNVEIDIGALERLSKKRRRIREHVDEYALAGPKRLYLLAEGRLVNLGAAEGHPASVMDMSFADQALCVEHLARRGGSLAAGVYGVPREIDAEVASLKLASMGITIDELTAEQSDYLNSWRMGT